MNLCADESYLTNGYLDSPIDWIPGMKNIRLKDLPSFIRTTNPDDIMLNFDNEEAQNTHRAWGVILNTFDELEHDVVEALKQMFSHLYTVGSLSTLTSQIPHKGLKSIESNLWKEDTDCLEWLDGKETASVVYVNFGSITVVTAQQLSEFAWGLANSNHPFLWVIRPDLVRGDFALLPKEFLQETQGR